MTEKEYRKLISDCEITIEQKNSLDFKYSQYNELLQKMKTPFIVKECYKYGIYASQMAINTTNYFDLKLTIDLDSLINEHLKNSLIINEIIVQVLLSIPTKSYELNKNKVRFEHQDGVVVNLELVESIRDFENITRFIEELNSKYSYFKNVYKVLKHLLSELNIEIINDYTLVILLAYALENYYQGNKYENYMYAFNSALDDLISQKKIELNQEYQYCTPKLNSLSKGYIIVDPYNNLNLAANLNDVNISDIRKLKKKIAKMYEVISNDVGSGILTLNINPVVNDDNTLSWSYDVVGRNLKNNGGTYANNDVEYVTATLKGYFRGLKAIISSNIYNKNIEVVTSIPDLLKCVEKDPSEAENNSRRKTITKYIEDNKLLISYQRKI